MKTFFKLSLGMVMGGLGLLALSPTPVASAQGDRICVYADTNYRGQSTCWNVGESVPNLGTNGRGDQISSIRVFGQARALVYKNKNYQGEPMEISSDVANLTSMGWNDRISAIKVVGSDWSDNNRSRGNWPDHNPSRGNWPDNNRSGDNGDRICAYADTNYRGQSTCWNMGESVPNLGTNGRGDRISSIRVFGQARALVYKNKNYQGKPLEISSDTPNLKRLNWNDRISAIKVVGSDWSDNNRSNGNGPDNTPYRGNWPDNNRPSGNRSGSDRLNWSGRVDGEVEILVRQNKANVRTISGTPTYNEHVSFSSPLPRSGATAQIMRIRGRGPIEIVQQASRDNDYTAIVHIRDTEGGADDYEFELTW